MARFKHTAEGTELHIDGEFVASWGIMLLSDRNEGIVLNMIEEAVRYGERKKAKQIREVIGARS